MSRVARHSTEEEIAALEQVCERLAAFGMDISLEWVDGYLTAVLASRRAIGADEWLPTLFGDDFDRVFADPADVQQAMDALMARCHVLASQLDVDSLLDDPETIRLAPLIMSFDDAARAEVVAAGHMTAEEAADQLQTGALWATGFLQVLDDFEDDWPDLDVDTDDGRWLDDCTARLMALTYNVNDLADHMAHHYPGEQLARDQLVDEALFAVQDLRLFWLDHAPKPETRRVAPTPGRNDPCHCGSGKKFKKCHGA